MNITGTVFLKTEAGNTVRSMSYNSRQLTKVIRVGDKESYNLEGATDYIKTEKARWEASDQFVGKRLVIEVQ